MDIFTSGILTFATLFLLQSHRNFVLGCKTSTWREMSMEELLLKSDIVVYGEDSEHRKLRNPQELDSRFNVYCVIKSGKYQVPGQVIIENIDAADECSGVRKQTEIGKTYIVGLNRTFSGYMRYAKVNPLQQTAFPATKENFDKVVATCGLDKWTFPRTGEQDGCPSVTKPRFCTKVRFPNTSASPVSTTHSLLFMSLTVVLTVYFLTLGHKL